MTFGMKCQWNLNRNSAIFTHENTSEIVVYQNVGHFVQVRDNIKGYYYIQSTFEKWR